MVTFVLCLTYTSVFWSFSATVVNYEDKAKHYSTIKNITLTSNRFAQRIYILKAFEKYITC